MLKMTTPDNPYGAGESFKFALGITLLMFTLMLVILVWMALTITGEPTEIQDTLQTTLDTLLKASAGVIFGLVSGRSLS